MVEEKIKIIKKKDTIEMWVCEKCGLKDYRIPSNFSDNVYCNACSNRDEKIKLKLTEIPITFDCIDFNAILNDIYSVTTYGTIAKNRSDRLEIQDSRIDIHTIAYLKYISEADEIKRKIESFIKDIHNTKLEMIIKSKETKDLEKKNNDLLENIRLIFKPISETTKNLEKITANITFRSLLEFNDLEKYVNEEDTCFDEIEVYWTKTESDSKRIYFYEEKKKKETLKNIPLFYLIPPAYEVNLYYDDENIEFNLVRLKGQCEIVDEIVVITDGAHCFAYRKKDNSISRVYYKGKSLCLY